MGSYDVAQICKNGHKITSTYNESPELRADFCDQCGEATINKCCNCNVAIRGYYSVPGIVSLNSYKVPSYCHNCGEPYPWTKKIIDNAVEIVALDDKLPEYHKEIIKSTFPDLITETPTTPVAIAKYKKYINSAQNFVKDGLRNLFIDVVNETVKKSLYG